MKVYYEIPIQESDPTKSKRMKELENEYICLSFSHRPDKNRLRELKKEMKLISKQEKEMEKLNKKSKRKQ